MDWMTEMNELADKVALNLMTLAQAETKKETHPDVILELINKKLDHLMSLSRFKFLEKVQVLADETKF